MYLKVEIGEHTKEYSFADKDVVSIGRSASCDIQLKTEGISRHHLEVRKKNGSFEVVDLGSTNGSYINDHRLTPDQGHPFNTFFPAKLGHLVYVYLVDNEESHEVGDLFSANATNVTSTNVTSAPSPDQKSTDKIKVTTKVQTHKNYKIKRSKPNKKQNDINQFKLTVFVTVSLMLGYIAYDSQDKWLPILLQNNSSINQMKKETADNKVKKRTIASTQAKSKAKSKSALNQQNKKQQSKAVLASAKQSLKSDKCLNASLSEICQVLKATKRRNYYEGAVVINNTLHVVVDVKSSLDHYFKYAPRYTKVEESRVLNTLMRNPNYAPYISKRMRAQIPINIYDYHPNMSEVDYNEYADAVIYSELLFSSLGDKIKSSSFDNVIMVLYEIKNNEYHYLKHRDIKKKFLSLNLDGLIYQLKVALYNSEFEEFKRIDSSLTELSNR